MTLKRFADQLFQISEFCFLGAIFILPFSKGALETLVVLSVALWLVAKVLTNGSLTKNRCLLLILGALIVSSSISAFDSGYPLVSLRGLLKLIKHVFILLLVADLFQKPKNIKRMLVVGFTSFGLVLIDSIIQSIYGKDLLRGLAVHYTNQHARLTGPYRSYGLLAAHIIAFFPIVLALNPRNWKLSGDFLRNIAWVLLVVLSIYVLYHTYCRGAWIAAFASLAMYAWMVRSKKMFFILLITLIAIPFVVPRSALIHPDIFKQEQSFSERNLLWSRAIQVISAKPLFGCGINTYTQNYKKFNTQKDWRLFGQKQYEGYLSLFKDEKESWRFPGHAAQIPDYSPHNGYLHLAAETGLVSLALFLILLGWSFWSGYVVFQRVRGAQKFLIAGLIAGLIALLFQMGVDTILYNLQTAFIIWLFLGLLVAVKNSPIFGIQRN